VYLKKFTPRLQRDLSIIPTPKDLPDVIESSFITGKVHTGKTVLAAFMALQEMKNIWLNAEIKDGIYVSKECEFEFIPVMNLLDKIRDTFDRRGEGDVQLTRHALVERYSTIHLLILDDLGAYKVTDYVLETLQLIINNRYEYLKKTIITSNFSLKELARMSGDDRLCSRIGRMCRIIHKTKIY